MREVDVSLILACYNEGPTFERGVHRIISACRKLRKSFEIIFVEDKSTDGTGETVKKLVGEINKVFLRIKNSRHRPNFAKASMGKQGFGGQAKAIFHRRNLGRGKSVSDGIMAARGNICGYLDVDLEVSESYIPLFVDEIEKGSDMAVGRRFYEGGLKSLARYLASKIYAYLVNSFLKIPISDTEAGFKFFRRSKILPVLSRVGDNHWFWDTEICARAYLANLSISEVPVLFVRRSDKKSTVRLVPDTINYLVALIRFRNQMGTSSK